MADASDRNASCTFTYGTIYFDEFLYMLPQAGTAWAVASGWCTITQLSDGTSQKYRANLTTGYNDRYEPSLGCGMYWWWSPTVRIGLEDASGAEQLVLTDSWGVSGAGGTSLVQSGDEVRDQSGNGYGWAMGVFQHTPESMTNCLTNVGTYSLDFHTAFSTGPA